MKTPERPLHDYVAEVSERTEVRMGVPLTMGTHEYGGVNFAVFSRHASRVLLKAMGPLERSSSVVRHPRHRASRLWRLDFALSFSAELAKRQL
jgi:hypothetical protein